MFRRRTPIPDAEMMCSGERFVLRRLRSERYIGIWDRLDDSDLPAQRFRLRQTRKAKQAYRAWETEANATPRGLVTLGLKSCTFIGRQRGVLRLGSRYDLGFSEVAVGFWDESRRKVSVAPYEAIRQMEVSGPDDVEGSEERFGLKEPTSSIVLSAILHGVMALDGIQTIVRFETTDGELAFHYTEQSPLHTRGELLPIFRHRMSAAAEHPTSAGSAAEQLRRLAVLKERRLLTQRDQEAIVDSRAWTEESPGRGASSLQMPNAPPTAGRSLA